MIAGPVADPPGHLLLLGCNGSPARTPPRASKSRCAPPGSHSAPPAILPLKRNVVLVDLEDEFEFDRHVQGQLGRAESQAGMASGLSENLNEQIRRAVDDGRLLCEAFRRGHVAGQSYDAGHAV